MNDERRVTHAVAHLISAVEKARAELEAQALSRCRLAEDCKPADDEEGRRAFESWKDVDREVQMHLQLGREALGRADREEAAGIVSVMLMGRRYDDREPEEILEEADRRRAAQGLAFRMMSARPEDFDCNREEEGDA